MTWGEMQSVLQLSVALNTIYLAIGDIRNPYVRLEENALNNITSKILEAQADQSKKVALSNIRKSVTELNSKFRGTLKDFEERDKWVGIGCVVFIIVYIGLLLVSSVYYATTFHFWFLIGIGIAGYLPITAGLIYNLLLVKKLNTEIRGERGRIEAELVNLI